MINITKIQIDRLAHGAFTCGTLQRPDSFILPVEFPLVFNEVYVFFLKECTCTHKCKDEDTV